MWVALGARILWENRGASERGAGSGAMRSQESRYWEDKDAEAGESEEDESRSGSGSGSGSEDEEEDDGDDNARGAASGSVPLWPQSYRCWIVSSVVAHACISWA